MPASPPPASARTAEGRCSGAVSPGGERCCRIGRDVASQRVEEDRAPCPKGGAPHRDLRPQLARDRNHRVPSKRRRSRGRGRNRLTRVHPHHPALQPAVRGDLARRDRAHPHLSTTGPVVHCLGTRACELQSRGREPAGAGQEMPHRSGSARHRRCRSNREMNRRAVCGRCAAAAEGRRPTGYAPQWPDDEVRADPSHRAEAAPARRTRRRARGEDDARPHGGVPRRRPTDRDPGLRQLHAAFPPRTARAQSQDRDASVASRAVRSLFQAGDEAARTRRSRVSRTD